MTIIKKHRNRTTRFTQSSGVTAKILKQVHFIPLKTILLCCLKLSTKTQWEIWFFSSFLKASPFILLAFLPKSAFPLCRIHSIREFN